jgi:hypothetical protein
MKKIIAFAAAATLGLGVAACDSAQENAAEDTADAMEDRADALEDSGVINDTQEEAMEDSAENLEDAAEDGAVSTTTTTTR